MSEDIAQPAARTLGAERTTGFLGRQWPWLVALAVALLVPWLSYDWATGRHSGFMVSMLSQMGIMIIFALSYNMQMGQTGLLSFGHAVFLGLGGYVTAHTLNAVKAGSLWLPLEVTPLAGGLGGLLFAILFGYFATKQRATAFAMITLGIGELVTSCALMFQTFFGGEGGVSTNRMIGRSLFGVGYAQPLQVYYLIVAWTAVAVALMLLLTRTPLGRMANACRDNFERAQFVGYDPRMVRFVQFSLSGFFAGIAGALYTLTYEIVTYDTVGGAMSANALLMTYIGGVGAFAGPVIGAVLIVLLQSWVSLLSNSWLVYAGVLFIMMVTFAPADLARGPPRAPGRPLRPPGRSLAPGGPRLRAGDRALLVPHHRGRPGQEPDALRRHREPPQRHAVDRGGAAPGRRRPLAARGDAPHRRGLGRGHRGDQGDGEAGVSATGTAPGLRMTDVHKSFGPTAVIMGVSLDVARGSRHAIIGPNGAGKTTLFNLISGRFPVSSGTIELGGQRIDGLEPHEINRRGLSRSFQVTSIFARMTVFENIRCGLLWSLGYRYSFWHLLGGERTLNDAAMRLLADVNLESRRDVPAGLLTYAEQRALEIGITIAGGADTILLDEPTAGMSRSEADHAVALIRRVTAGKTLVMVEHDMSVVFDVADVVTVLVYGQVIASGPPAEIRASRAVQEAYLGVPAELA